MTVTIGRFGLDIDVDSFATIEGSGDQLTASYTFQADTVEDANTLRDQFRGLLDNPDEPVVPVTWDADPTINGFYRVTDGSMKLLEAGMAIGGYQFDVTLERIASSSAPLVEGRSLFAQRDSAGPSPTHYTAIPDDAWGEQIDSSSTTTRAADSGDVTLYMGDDLANSRPWWGINPEDWYAGAARIEQSILDDGPALVGRQQPQNTTSPGNPFVQLSNGLIRVGPYHPVAHSTDAGVVVQRYDSGWRSLHFFRLFQNGTTPISASLSAVTVLRNSPESASLRVTWSTGWTLDITLRRGALMAELHMAIGTPSAPVTLPMGIEHDGISSDASSSISSGWGLKASSADGDGDLWVIAAGQSVTLSTTNGRMYRAASAGAASFGVGVCDNTTGNTPVDLVEQYCSAGSEQYQVVGR